MYQILFNLAYCTPAYTFWTFSTHFLPSPNWLNCFLFLVLPGPVCSMYVWCLFCTSLCSLITQRIYFCSIICSNKLLKISKPIILFTYYSLLCTSVVSSNKCAILIFHLIVTTISVVLVGPLGIPKVTVTSPVMLLSFPQFAR